MAKQTRSRVPDDVNVLLNGSTGEVTHARNPKTGNMEKITVGKAKKIIILKSRSLGASLSIATALFNNVKYEASKLNAEFNSQSFIQQKMQGKRRVY
tara:strand:+ start:45 stop:335 length:291 start_codon:yes stop_codon:yes gene_type:complete